MVSVDSATRRLLGAGWLRSARVDLPFLLAIPALAIACGLLAAVDRRLVLALLLVDFALLTGPWAALVGDLRGNGRAERIGGSLRAAWMPLLLWTILAGLAFAVAAWLPITLYFYWQWFNGAQRSWSLTESYRRHVDPAADLGDRALLTAAFYMVPAWGILHRCAQGPDSFLGLNIQLMPVPQPMVHVIGIAACSAVALWMAERVIAWSEGRLPLAHTIYALSHFAVFAVAFRLIDDVVAGWLVAHIWRNAQDLYLARLSTRRESGESKMTRRAAAGMWIGLAVVVAVAGIATAFVGAARLAALLPGAAILLLAADAWDVIGADTPRQELRYRRNAPLARSGTGADTRLSG